VTYSIPNLSGMNITFSDPWYLAGVGWIVNLTVPHETYDQGEPIYEYYDPWGWIRTIITFPIDGQGWLFLNATGDVDCYVSTNSTGVYWISPSPKAGEKASDPGEWPSPSADGVAGTADDSFGDGTPDPAGSSILYLCRTVDTMFWAVDHWEPFFTYNWTAIWTTGTAYDIVTQTGSSLNGYVATQVGEPWEFIAGEDHPEYDPVPWRHPYWNAYITYASSWSMFGISIPSGTLNLLVAETQKHVRENCLIMDINCDEKVDIFDIRMTAKAFGSEQGHPNYDPRRDVADPRGIIDIFDIRKIAKDYGKELTPNGIIQT